MYKRYTILFIVLAAALGGYGIYWFMAANRASEALPQTLASVMPEGLSIKYSKMKRSGFPFRIIFTIETLEITGEGGNRLATDQVEAVMQPTNARHIIFRLPSPVRYALADAQNGGLYRGVLTAERFLASAVALGGDDNGFRLDLDARELVIERSAATPLVAERAQAHLRPTREKGVYDVVLSGKNVAWDGFSVEQARSTGTLIYDAENQPAPRLKFGALSTTSKASDAAEEELNGFLAGF